jgi:peptidyl-prolyl cis-trans isomerase C
MMKRLIVVVSVFLSLGVVGCTRGGDNTVIAKVNQSRITVGEFKKQLDSLDNLQFEQAAATDPKARKDFLEDLIGIELVVQEAKRQGLDRDAEYKKSLEAIKKDYEESKKRLERRYQEAARNELFRELLKKELAAKAKSLPEPTDKEIRDFYDKNVDKLSVMSGKKVPLKDVERQIKDRLMQEKQRDLYLAYLKELREKSQVTIDEKGMEVLAASLTAPTLSLQPTLQPAKKDQQPGEKR